MRAAAAATVHANCTICEAACGITVHLDGPPGSRKVVRVEGDRDDPVSRGHVCPKVVAMASLQDDPDRLRRPSIRRGDRWEDVDWDTALDFAAEGLMKVRAEHGPQALALYRGNPAIHDAGTMLSTGVLLGALGTQKAFSAASIDSWPRFFQCNEMYGSPIRIPVPDIDRTHFLLILGANPAVSQGSIMTAPGIRDRIRAVRERGGKVVVVDPRRTETAALADEHHFIRPGTDAAMLLAMVHLILAGDVPGTGPRGEGRMSPMLRERVEGVDALLEALRPFTPESVTAVCGVPAATIRRLAAEFVASPAAAAYGRMGTCVQDFGGLACWAIDLLAIVSGHIDRPGTLMWARPAAPMYFAFEAAGRPVPLGRWASRGGREERFGDLPITALAEEIEMPGDGQVRALVTVAGNPAHTAPNAPRLDRALAALSFMVSLDGYRNETTRHADVILPPCGPLQRDHYDVLLMHVAVRNGAKWSPASLPRSADEPDGWTTALALARRLAAPGMSDAAFDDGVVRKLVGGALAASPWHEQLPLDELIAALGTQRGPGRVVDAMLRVGPSGEACGRRPDGLSLAALQAQPHGIDLGPLEPAMPDIVVTPSGRIALAPARMLDDLPRLRAAIASPADGLRLINRRDARSMNSWLHNVAALSKGRDRCTLQMHPLDAARRGIADGATVRLGSRIGAMQALAELTDAVMPGVVCLPHGFGHQAAGARQAVAAAMAGDNVNRVCDDQRFDAASGAIALFGGPVTVEAVV